jgi:hypothetical protein
MARFALLSAGNDAERTLRTVERYLPSNYFAQIVDADGKQSILIFGSDVAGWGMDTYVIPRLASGMYYAREIRADEADEMAPILAL